MQAMFRFKKSGGSFSRIIAGETNAGLNISEISVLNCIKEHSNMYSALSVSKAAVSQILGSLEEKGYIEREINRSNRRKIIITLTAKGQDAVEESEKVLGRLISSIIAHMGEAEIDTLIRLVNDFVDFVESRTYQKQ
jgi:DNA-binding MarR family transcriptional regulator